MRTIWKFMFLISSSLLLSASVNAAVFFQDDFDTSPSRSTTEGGTIDIKNWNLCYGAFAGPPSQEGGWVDGDIRTTYATHEGLCGSSNAATLRSLFPWSYYSGVCSAQAGAGTANVFMSQTEGKNGSNAIQTTLINGCSNEYPGGIAYQFSTSRHDVYISMWIKIESGYNKSSFSDGCKLPLRVWFSPRNDDELYIQYQGNGSGAFGSSNIKVYQAGPFNNGEWWDTGVTPAMLYNDHDWHQLEFRVKLNSTSSTYDGEITAWIDGTQTGQITGQRFYTSGTKYHDVIWFEQGNCSNESWSQTSHKSVWFDNIKLGDSYIAYDGSSSGSGSLCTGVSASGVTFR